MQWDAPSGSSLRHIHTIEKKELLGAPINSLAVHPKLARRLLVQTRDHQLVSLDTRLGNLSVRYRGHQVGLAAAARRHLEHIAAAPILLLPLLTTRSSRVHHQVGEYNVRAAYSPDGRMVVCGSEDGSLFVWEEESGAVLLDSWAVGLNGPLLQVAWCPHDHVLACCSYGPHNPVLIYFHDPEVAIKQSKEAASRTAPPAATAREAKAAATASATATAAARAAARGGAASAGPTPAATPAGAVPPTRVRGLTVGHSRRRLAARRRRRHRRAVARAQQDRAAGGGGAAGRGAAGRRRRGRRARPRPPPRRCEQREHGVGERAAGGAGGGGRRRPVGRAQGALAPAARAGGVMGVRGKREGGESEGTLSHVKRFVQSLLHASTLTPYPMAPQSAPHTPPSRPLPRAPSSGAVAAA